MLRLVRSRPQTELYNRLVFRVVLVDDSSVSCMDDVCKIKCLPSISAATRCATDIAATRRGCVQAIIFPFVCGRSE